MIAITGEVDIGTARRAATTLCYSAGFTVVEAGSVATSVSELARNLWQHAGGGLVTLALHGDEDLFIEIRAEDVGPGIPNISRAMEDGYSTGGSLGSGLPGVRRLMDEFHIESTVGEGTRVVARKWRQRRV